jgi:ABC-type branched-subunit amino acid transport system substrate-binding protein/tetratricopeptide (TPR) repeat protein
LTNLEAAVTCYKKALDVVREHHLADKWIAKLDQAISECYQQRIQELKYCADIAKNNGDYNLLTDQLASALDNYVQALDLYRLVESRLDEAIVLNDIGSIQCSLQNRDAAMEYYQQALTCFKQMNHRHNVGTVLQAMGDVARSRHEKALAERYYNEALDLFRQVGDRFSEASVLAAMGKEVPLYRKVGEANLSHIEGMDSRSHQGQTAVLEPPVHSDTIVEQPDRGNWLMIDMQGGSTADNDTIARKPDRAEHDTPSLPDGPGKPERATLVADTGTVFVKQRVQSAHSSWTGSERGRWIIGILSMLIILIVGGGSAMATLLRGGNHPATAANQPPPSIGVVKIEAGKEIGLSDGTVAFDINQPGRTDSVLKQQAAEKMAAGDRNSAMSLLAQAVKNDKSDSEALTYLEDLRVLQSGQPYITLIFGTKITGDQIGLTGERSGLQGAYIAQQEHNKNCQSDNCVLVRLLIANTGNDANNAKLVVKQIVQAAQSDPTIIGIEGWSVSQDSFNIVDALKAAQLPMVSSSASSDWLTGISPYFFRVCPPDSRQAELAAKYAMNTLHAQRIALFVDPSNAYSASLASAFKQHATSESVIHVETYTVGTYAQNTELVRANLQEVLSYNPDLVYFAGYSEDTEALLKELQTYQQFARLPVMGGDALYPLVDTGRNTVGLDRLVFTAFAAPGEGQYIDPSVQDSPFFQEYAQLFAPKGVHLSSNTPTGDVILSYDAMRVLLQASQNAFTNKKAPLTRQDLEQALLNITGSQAFQGVSGQIAFGPNGDPSDKAVVILNVDKQGIAHILDTGGRFLLPVH